MSQSVQFDKIDQKTIYDAAEKEAQKTANDTFKQGADAAATGDRNWSGPDPVFGNPDNRLNVSAAQYDNQGLTPKPVDGYLDLMEKHWGETDLTKVNEDLQKTLGNRYDPAFKQNLTAAVYTGDRINKGTPNDWNPETDNITDSQISSLKTLKTL